MGNLGQDPKIGQGSKSKYASFSIATEEYIGKDEKTNEAKYRTEWHNVTVWGKDAEYVEKYIKKGDKVYIEGRIETSKVGDGDSAKYFTKVVAREIQKVSSSNKANGAGAAGSTTSTNVASNEDIPF
jgi:single-strand DNA-binding protein